MDRKTAVNLKSIDTAGVEVSYYYSTSKIDTTETLTGETDFDLQQLEVGGEVYIYVLVSPINTAIPANINRIAAYAFYNCHKLIIIKFDEVAKWYADADASYSDRVYVFDSFSSLDANLLRSDYKVYYLYKG